MKYRLMSHLACPACRSTRLALETRRTETRPVCTGHFEPEETDIPGVDLSRREEIEVLEGAIHCKDCAAIYAIREGVPRMLLPGSDEGPESAHRWTSFDSAHPEWEENFLELSAPLRARDFLGKLVLDAGCGFGRHAYFAARFGAEVIAMDANGDAIASALANTRSLERVHLVQGDLQHPPFRDDLFDIVLSFGVLHYLESPTPALDALSGVLRPGGRYSIWVYGPRQGVALSMTNAVRGVSTALEPEELYRVSQGIATGLRIFSHTPYRFLQKVPVAGAIVSHLPVHDHHKWPFKVVVADVYDRLRHPIKHWFTSEELEVWFGDRGFADVSVSRRVRNNESFMATGIRR